MAQTIEFSGHSDDVFQMSVPGQGTGIEAACTNGIHSFKVIDADGDGLQVVAVYINPGVWSVGIAQLDKNRDVPTHWDLFFDLASNGYSAKISLCLPPGVVIEGGNEKWVVEEDESNDD